MSRSIKLYFSLLIILLITAELSPYLLYPIVYQESFSASEIRAKQNALMQTESSDSTIQSNINEYLGNHVLHPYLGFVNKSGNPYNDYGFPELSPMSEKDTGTMRIAITGGSVAMGLYHFSRETLVKKLRVSNFSGSKNIELVLLALPGYKQPQQLMALNYFLSLGASFDVLINLDGFNEVALPYSDNLKFGVNPFFPRSWSVYSQKGLNKEVQMTMARQELNRKQRIDQARKYGQGILKYSKLALLIWNVGDVNLQNDLYAADVEIQTVLSKESLPYQTTGPKYDLTDTTSLFVELSKHWKRSSILMNSICRNNGIQYFHFLQPNQYVEGSKTLTEEELLKAYHEGPYDYKFGVKQGYPLLQAEGESLMRAEVKYDDLTMLFKNESSTVYSDECCHFTQFGYDLIAERIANEMAK